MRADFRSLGISQSVIQKAFKFLGGGTAFAIHGLDSRSNEDRAVSAHLRACGKGTSRCRECLPSIFWILRIV
jgi:hypothetical protein